jgi:hypothetical protein
MNNLAASPTPGPLLAQSQFESMGSHFRGDRAWLTTDDIVIGGLLLIGGAALAWYLRRLLVDPQRSRRRSNPRALFRKLCTAHGLGIGDRRLLWQLARHHRLDHPARLFLEPERFEPSELSPRLKKDAATIRALRTQLFALPAGADAMTTLAGYATGIDLPGAM